MAAAVVTTLADLSDDKLSSAASDMASVSDFYANKSVFITGGTGFLGTVLIEAILSASPDVGKIYVLVRDKYGSNADVRIKRMIKKAVSISCNGE